MNCHNNENNSNVTVSAASTSCSHPPPVVFESLSPASLQSIVSRNKTHWDDIQSLHDEINNHNNDSVTDLDHNRDNDSKNHQQERRKLQQNDESDYLVAELDLLRRNTNNSHSDHNSSSTRSSVLRQSIIESMHRHDEIMTLELSQTLSNLIQTNEMLERQQNTIGSSDGNVEDGVGSGAISLKHKIDEMTLFANQLCGVKDAILRELSSSESDDVATGKDCNDYNGGLNDVATIEEENKWIKVEMSHVLQLLEKRKRSAEETNQGSYDSGSNSNNDDKSSSLSSSKVIDDDTIAAVIPNPLSFSNQNWTKGSGIGSTSKGLSKKNDGNKKRKRVKKQPDTINSTPMTAAPQNSFKPSSVAQIIELLCRKTLLCHQHACTSSGQLETANEEQSQYMSIQTIAEKLLMSVPNSNHDISSNSSSSNSKTIKEVTQNLNFLAECHVVEYHPDCKDLIRLQPFI